MPRESDGGFDPKGTVRGYGPYTLEEYRPSSLYTWKKNPNYYVKGRPFFDGVENPIVPEYATRLSQFKAGNTWLNQANQLDVIQTKKDDQRLLLRQGETFTSNPSSAYVFGYEGNSPFKDERVRQAVSMLIDRELMTDTIGGRESFAKEGLDVPTRYHTVVGAGWEGYWVDPQDEKKFGPNAKYLALNIAEAKKLLSAAGFANGVDANFYYVAGAIYGAAYTNVANIIPGMLAEGGIRLKQDPKEYQTDWLPGYYYGYAQGEKKGSNGMIYIAERSYPTVAGQLFATMHKDGPRFHGMSPNGLNAKDGDPQVNSMIDEDQDRVRRRQAESPGPGLRPLHDGQGLQHPLPHHNPGLRDLLALRRQPREPADLRRRKLRCRGVCGQRLDRPDEAAVQGFVGPPRSQTLEGPARAGPSARPARTVASARIRAWSSRSRPSTSTTTMTSSRACRRSCACCATRTPASSVCRRCRPGRAWRCVWRRPSDTRTRPSRRSCGRRTAGARRWRC